MKPYYLKSFYWFFFLLLTLGCNRSRIADADHFPTCDKVPIEVRCEEVLFIVSFNDDDDNFTDVPDHQEVISPTRENNLRKFIFNEPQAMTVFIGEPVVIKPKMAPALNIRVRAYDENFQPFDFTVIHPKGVIMYLEGIGSASGDELDIAFEYQYFEDTLATETLCGPGARGTVVDLNARWRVNKGSGSRFDGQRKMLIGGDARTRASYTPIEINPVTMEWRYDGAGTYNPTDALESRFTADTIFTPHNRLDMDSARFVISKYNQEIEAHYPVNITAARHCIPIAGQINGWDDTTDFITPEGNVWTLIPNFGRGGASIDYRILDQFLEPIKNSAWPRGRVPKVRENIRAVLTSPIGPVNNWIQNTLRSTDNWKTKKDGLIEDRLRAFNIPKGPFTHHADNHLPNGQIIYNQHQFVPDIQAVGGVLMRVPPPATHQWEVSISEDVATIVTDNEFSVTTAEIEVVPTTGNTNIKIKSRYVVNPR